MGLFLISFPFSLFPSDSQCTLPFMAFKNTAFMAAKMFKGVLAKMKKAAATRPGYKMAEDDCTVL